jgi:hypothetical protein
VIPSTDFSARWEGWFYVDQPGTWSFIFTADDGGRVWIDNELVIDFWYDHRPLTRTYSGDFAAGYHLIRVEYYQSDGSMTSQLTMSPAAQFPEWLGEYFDNPYTLGEPRFRASDADINFNWGSGGPDPQLPSDNFSVRWSRLFNFPAGSYTFTATADDGIRVWAGDTPVIDAWLAQQPQTYTGTAYLSGKVPLRVEYFEQSGQAVVNLNIQPAGTHAGPGTLAKWRGEFFGNPRLEPPASCEQNTSAIRFDWKGESPGCNLNSQFFSARWTAGHVTPATGFYTLLVRVDDGARVFLDDKLVLDAWREQPPTSYSTTVYLDAGEHSWRVEYFQGAGGAQISFDILAGVSMTSAVTGAASEFVVDAGGTGWTQNGEEGGWRAAEKGENGSSLWSNTRAFMAPQSKSGRWYPKLTLARAYQVLAYIPAGVATTKKARYWIYHNGRYDSVAVPQVLYQDAWVSLGMFDFSAQGNEYVSLTDVTYEPGAGTTIVWDAVKFVPQ